MVFIIVLAICIIGVLISKHILRKWFNHLSIYCLIWSGLILLYEWKLLPYVDIIPLAWFYIASTFLAFLFGIITFTSARNIFNEKLILNKNSNSSLKIFLDGGITVKYTIIFFSLISLYSAYQNWMVLIDKFGSIPLVFLNAQKIYELNVEGGVKGIIPFISNFGYVAVFLSGIYTAFKGRFSFLSFLPFIGIVIRELATVGRMGMLLALLEFLFTLLLLRHLLRDDFEERFKFSKKNAAIAFTFLMAFFILSASLVRISRGSFENYTGASTSLNKFKHNIILTPSLYLYLSSDVGVLSKYAASDGEKTGFGQNTFLTVYHVLNKFDVVERGSDYQKGYFIPMWTNTGTYIRELHADFGITGMLLIPYFIGLIVTWMWFKFYTEKSLIVLGVLVYFYLIIGFSFLIMLTRSSYWSIGLLLIVILVPILEKISEFRYYKKVERISGRT